MELCTVPGGQPIRPSAPPELMKKLDEKRIKFCVRPPAERLNRLINGLQVRCLKYLELSGIQLIRRVDHHRFCPTQSRIMCASSESAWPSYRSPWTRGYWSRRCYGIALRLGTDKSQLWYVGLCLQSLSRPHFRAQTPLNGNFYMWVPTAGSLDHWFKRTVTGIKNTFIDPQKSRVGRSPAMNATRGSVRRI